MNRQLPARVAVAEPVLFQELNDECVLLDMEASRYYSLDDVGSQMWRRLMETGNPEQALAQLQAYYAAEPATLRADLAEFIGKLNEARLVTIEA